MRFTITVAGDVQFDREIEAIGARVEHGFEPVWSAIAKDMTLITASQFATGGVFASGGWPALKEKYLAQKQRWVKAGKTINGRKAVSTAILRLTDRLKDSLLNATDPEHVSVITPWSLEWGTSVFYAKFHQNPGPSSHVPQRRVLELPEQRRRAYARAMLTYVRTGGFSL